LENEGAYDLGIGVKNVKTGFVLDSIVGPKTSLFISYKGLLKGYSYFVHKNNTLRKFSLKLS